MGKKWTELQHGDVSGAIQRLGVALGPNAGMVVDRINHSQIFTQDLAEFAVNWKSCLRSFDKSRTSLNPQWLHAREIMGKNFFGVEEGMRYFGVNPLERKFFLDHLAVLAEIPFTEFELGRCKDTHILAAVFPSSILDLRGWVERGLFLDHEDAWYSALVFAKKREGSKWCLFPKTALSEVEESEWSPRAATYIIIGHFLATGERLYETTWARCFGYIAVGHFGMGGLDFASNWPDDRNDMRRIARTDRYERR